MAGRGETDGGREGIEADETQGDGKGGGVAAGPDGALGLHVDGVKVGVSDAGGPDEAAWACWGADRGEVKGAHSLGQVSDVAGLVPGVVLGAFAAGAEAGGLVALSALMGVDMVIGREREGGRGDACLDGLAQGTKVVLLGHEGAGLGEGPKHGILCLVALVCLGVLFAGIAVFHLPLLLKRGMCASSTRTSRRRARHVYFV